MTTNVKINSAHGFSNSELSKLRSAVSLLESVINSEEFRLRVLNHTFKGNKTFQDNLGLSNTLIYNRLLAGSEILKPESDCVWDVDITIYTSSWFSRGTVGYTYPDTLKTWINRRWFSVFTAGEIAANIAHEYCHKNGFDHSFYNNSSRPYSVPYAIGTIISELAARKALTVINPS